MAHIPSAFPNVDQENLSNSHDLTLGLAAYKTCVLDLYDPYLTSSRLRTRLLV